MATMPNVLPKRSHSRKLPMTPTNTMMDIRINKIRLIPATGKPESMQSNGAATARCPLFSKLINTLLPRNTCRSRQLARGEGARNAAVRIESSHLLKELHSTHLQPRPRSRVAKALTRYFCNRCSHSFITSGSSLLRTTSQPTSF